MKTTSRQIMKKQDYRPKKGVIADMAISDMGANYSDGTYLRQGKEWTRYQVCQQETFSLVALEAYRNNADHISYTRQQRYIKVNFWLSGRHSTILDGFGQYDHDCPEVFITSGPEDMRKVDVLNRNNQLACLALCVLPEFFTTHMGLAVDELPEPLRGILTAAQMPYSFHQFSLTPVLQAATSAILMAPFAIRRQPLYTQAKAIELMCLLIHQMEAGEQQPVAEMQSAVRNQSQLHDAREMVAKRYADPLTLEQISKQVGLNRVALSSGFRQLFGCSVHDYLQKVRMEKAYELVRDRSYSIKQVADAVGYNHYCNFSTAFHAYFGFSPRKARAGSRSAVN